MNAGKAGRQPQMMPQVISAMLFLVRFLAYQLSQLSRPEGMPGLAGRGDA